MYTIVDGQVVEREEDAPPVAEDAAVPPSFARAALRSKRPDDGSSAKDPPAAFDAAPTKGPPQSYPEPAVGHVSPTADKQTLPGTGAPASVPPAGPTEGSADKPKGKKKRRRRKRKKQTLPGTGTPSRPPPAKRKETLIGAGLGKGASKAGGAPATASMPPSGETPPADRVIPWVGDSDTRVEVEIAPVRQQEVRPAAESDPDPSELAPEAAAKRSEAPPDDGALAAEEPTRSDPPPSDAVGDEAAAVIPSESAPRVELQPRRIFGLPRNTAVASGALLVVVVGVLLVTIGPVSVRIGEGDPAPQAEPDPGPIVPAPQAAPTAADSVLASATVAPVASSEADGSELPLHEGYLVVKGTHPKLYVYGRGKRLGQVGAKMRLRCGAISVRLGDRAPEHWYSSPRRLRVECQSVTTEELEPGDPVSILEEAVPAEAPTSVSSDGATFQPPPPSLPPPSSTGSDWIPPEI